MLVKLTGDQVSRNWIETIKPAIANSLPDYVTVDEDTMNNILTQIISDIVHCWVVMNGGEVVGICVTMVTEDPASKSKAYLIYSLNNITSEEFPEHLWDTCMKQIAGVAKSYGCNKVYCYTDNDQIAQRAAENGGVFNQQLITFHLTE